MSAPLDVEQALEMTGGDADFLKEILEEFMTHSARQIATLQQASQSGDNKKMEFEAHAIKGSSVTVGATRLGKIAEELEQVAAGAQAGNARQLVADLDVEFRSVCEFVRSYLKLEEPPAVDIAKALEMAGGDVEFLKEVMGDFVQHSSTQMKNIEQGLADSNMEVLRFEAHTIKGSAATIGAMPVSQAALQLERAATGAQPGDLHQLVANIRTQFERVRAFQAQYQG